MPHWRLNALFERRVRILVASGDYGRAETYLRRMATLAGFADLNAALDRPLADFTIDDWDTIEAQLIEFLRQNREGSQRGEVKSLILGLANNSDLESPRVTLSFAYSDTANSPSLLLDAEHRDPWLQERDARVWDVQDRLPDDKFPPVEWRGLPTRGFEQLFAMQRSKPVAAEPWVFCREHIAAAAILLRFHQIVDRQVRDPGLPRPLAVFAASDSVCWPMETNTLDFVFHVTRRVAGAVVRPDSDGTAAILAGRESDHRSKARLELQQSLYQLLDIGAALREWPWWTNFGDRRRLAGSFRLFRKGWIASLARDGVTANGLSDVELAATIARTRYPDDWEPLLRPLPWDQTQGLHRLYALTAKTFGGPRLATRYNDLPDDLEI